MAHHLISKKAAVLIDGLKVSVRIDEVGRVLGVPPLGSLTGQITNELAAYIAELEAIVADIRATQ